MTTTLTPLDYLGMAPLFLGDETRLWTLERFTQAVGHALAFGFTALLVKVADGAAPWYATMGGWQCVLATCAAAGIVVIPYLYSYGRYKRHVLEEECALLREVQTTCGIVVADMRVEYNGKPEWAYDVCKYMKNVPGLFGLTTYSFPSWQKWESVLRTLSPCVDFYLPQVYSNFNASIYKRDFAYCKPCYPVINLGTDCGPNDVVGIARASQSPCVGFWRYGRVTPYAGQVREIMGMLKARQQGMRV